MAKIAILGFGNIGSGVLEVLQRNASTIASRAGQSVEVKYICDIRDFSAHEQAQLFVNNIDVILNDPEVTLVVETIGGLKPAYFYVKSCLESGRSVVTSNKELVATHGAELLQIAKEKGICFLFEASVGGGMPLITPMHQCLAANLLTRVSGIVNGTTNFMLTKMEQDNMSFDDALKLAQSLGYAETIDPSADVDGIDAQRKISILTSLAFGSEVHPQNVRTRGIRSVTPADIKAAAAQHCAVKLIAWAQRDDDGYVCCGVEPMLVPHSSQLSGVSDVFNAVQVRGDMLGDVLFYGKGAGKLPTASAVVADVLDALKKGASIHDTLYWTPTAPAQDYLTSRAAAQYYVRAAGTQQAVQQQFADAQVLNAENGEVQFLLPGVTPAELDSRLAAAAQAGVTVQNYMQVMAE